MKTHFTEMILMSAPFIDFVLSLGYLSHLNYFYLKHVQMAESSLHRSIALKTKIVETTFNKLYLIEMKKCKCKFHNVRQK